MTACEGEQSGANRSGTPRGFTRGPILVVTEAAQMRTIIDVIEAIGTTLANESVTITAKVTDTISQVNFEDGDIVKTGAVLVELTNQEETALLAEAKANVDDANTQYKRLEGLLAQGSVPESQVDEARARYSAAEARYQSILARLDDRLVRAPFDGMLGFRSVSTGTLVTPGATITTLDDISIIKLDFSIPEVYLGLIKPGLNLIADSPAYPDKRFSATVRTIKSRVDPITRAATVRALIMNDERDLRPGMLMTVKITTAERSALMVPETALMQRSDEAFVFTVKAGQAQIRQIVHGARYEGWVEILEGLDVGEAVISEGVIKVRQGSAVSVDGGEPNGAAPQRRQTSS
ncbi:MAG: efflux RND transporter periplasmic adaptor subunit [Gammaproteobacteria bacterium]|nr:efflux RND transporter periplasmic adaptor subunit [Gammaproteobacteria bacterium]